MQDEETGQVFARAPRQTIMFQPCAEEFPEMLVYSDSDWAGCLRTRKSTSGGVLTFQGGVLKTWSSTQASIAQSSGESEYYALVRAASEALGMQAIMRDLGWFCKIRLLVDSSAAKSTASRMGLGKLRHLEFKFLWLQECVRRGKVVLSKVRGDVNPADVLTKPKSLEDMRLLLNFSCLHWCDGRVPDNHYSGNRIELVNNVGSRNTCRDGGIEFVNSVRHSSFEDTGNVGRYYFVNSPTVRRRGGCWSSNSLFRTQPHNSQCL